MRKKFKAKTYQKSSEALIVESFLLKTRILFK